MHTALEAAPLSTATLTSEQILSRIGLPERSERLPMKSDPLIWQRKGFAENVLLNKNLGSSTFNDYKKRVKVTINTGNIHE